MVWLVTTMQGASVIVHAPTAATVDRFGNVESTWTSYTVDDVLIAPGATADLEASRPEGVQVAYSLHFPKTFSESLEGCKIELPAPYGGVYRVIGKPSPYMGANTPTRWNTPVEVERADG